MNTPLSLNIGRRPSSIFQVGCLTSSILFFLCTQPKTSQANDKKTSTVWVTAGLLCRTVSKKEPIQLLKKKSRISSSPISVWTKISGDKDSLKKLRAEKLLPLKHLWVHDTKIKWVEVYPDLHKAEKEPIVVGTVSDLSSLAQEVTDKKAFDWRTWSTKSNFMSGTYRIYVVFQNDEFVTDASGNPWYIQFNR